MDKEYYTPTIDEFCLGFEFEYFEREFDENNEYVDSKWIPSEVILSETNKAGTTHLSLKDIKLQYYQIGLALLNKTIRVKKLNEDDLIDIGFNKVSGVTFRYKCWEIDLFSSSIQNLAVSNFYGEKGKEFYEEIFYGTIFNKTELKKLLKQLDIDIDENIN